MLGGTRDSTATLNVLISQPPDTRHAAGVGQRQPPGRRGSDFQRRAPPGNRPHPPPPGWLGRVDTKVSSSAPLLRILFCSETPAEAGSTWYKDDYFN